MSNPLTERLESIKETQISEVKREGNSFLIRGYKYEDLINYSSFEEVIHLLLFKKLPNQEELLQLIQKISSFRHIPKSILKIVEKVPLGDPYVMVTSSMLILRLLEEQNETKNLTDLALRIISIIAPITFYWFHFHKSNGTKRIETYTGPNDTIAENSLKLLNLSPEVDQYKLKLYDRMLMIVSEISMAPPSLFSGRVAVTAGASLIQSFICFLCPFSGKRHGGAIHELNYMCKDFKSVDEAEQVVKEKLKKKEIIYGFGHPYFVGAGDPRLPILNQTVSLCKPSKNTQAKHEIYMKILETVEKSKLLVPNLDFFSSVIFNLIDIPFEIYLNMFYISRSAGALSHIIEQIDKPFKNVYAHAHVYTGPRDKQYVPLKDRKQFSPKF